MAPPLRAVLFGNSFASRVQIPALRWAGGCEVVGIAGRDRAKAERTAREHGIERATDDWRELLELDPDLVLVTTPVDLHREMTLAALERTDAAVLCEKPFALDAREAEEMVARAAGRPAWIDHELRWSPQIRALREIVAGGSLGEVRHADVEMLFPPRGRLDRPWSWWYDASRGGGVLGALGSHLVDLVRFLLGEADAVRGELRTFERERPDAQGTPREVTADEYASLRMRLAGGVLAELRTSVMLPSERAFRMQITGSEGYARFYEPDVLLVGPIGGEPSRVETPPLPSSSELGMPEYGFFGRSLPLFLRDVVAAARERRSELPFAATFEDGLATQRVLDAARRSAASGGGWEEC